MVVDWQHLDYVHTRLASTASWDLPLGRSLPCHAERSSVCIFGGLLRIQVVVATIRDSQADYTPFRSTACTAGFKVAHGGFELVASAVHLVSAQGNQLNTAKHGQNCPDVPRPESRE